MVETGLQCCAVREQHSNLSVEAAPCLLPSPATLWQRQHFKQLLAGKQR